MAIAQLMIQIVVVVVAGRLLAKVLRRFGQPSVIAEVVAGIVLGPSLLGLLWPAALAALFPADTLPGLALVSQLGLVFFMFLVGLEFDPTLLRGRGHHSVVISHASIVFPFLLGGLLAWPLHSTLAPAGVPFTPFALFLGAAMSVTAFPVLARILAERGFLRTQVGAITLSCAAVDDVTAWCILAFVVSVARAEGLGPAIWTTALALVFTLVVIGVVRPLLQRLGPREGQAMSADTVAVAFVLVLLAATTTEIIGIHALFGAFLLGAVMPRSGGLSAAIAEKIEDFVTIAILPLFFAYSGLRTQIGLLDTATDWAVCGVIILCACLGKFGGSTLAARLVGIGWREASAIGILMNTRGLMELIVLNVGLDLGILSDKLFTMMVIMALVTTWMTSPLLEWFYPRKRMLETTPGLADAPLAPPAAAGQPGPVLLCVSDPAIVPGLWAVTRHLVPSGTTLLALHLVRSDRPSAYLGGEPDPSESEALDALALRAREAGITARLLSFVAADPAEDIVRFAEAKSAALILLGSHRSVLGEGARAGVAGRVLANATVDVAMLVDHASRDRDRSASSEESSAEDVVRGVWVMGEEPALQGVVDRLLAAGLPRVTGPAPGVLLVASLGTTVPDGVSALLVRPRSPA